MPIPFVCPHCGTSTEVDDQYAGSTGPCATCGKTISIPAPSDGSASASLSSEGTAGGMSVATILLILLGVLLAGVCVILLLVALLYPAVRAVRESGRKVQCDSNLNLISVALMMYEADHGTFPPAYLADENGKPLHSWRVLLLPYLNENLLYEQYNFDEPWDGPNNILLSDRMPFCYGCPADPQTASQETSYMVIVGPDTMFPGAEAMSRADCRDGTGVTLAVVEVANTSIVWTEPVDLDAGKMLFEITAGGKQDMGSNHVNGAHALFCDGTVRFLPNTISPDELEAYSTRAGGEEVYPDF